MVDASMLSIKQYTSKATFLQLYHHNAKWSKNV